MRTADAIAITGRYGGWAVAIRNRALDFIARFMPMNDSPQVASFLALSYSWLAELARAVEEVQWK
jgi:hypothetical protein